MTAEKKLTYLPMNCEVPSAIIMHTYRLSVTEHQKASIINKLDPERTAVICDNNSDTCYLIIPATDAGLFLSPASGISFKRVSVSELREKYRNNLNYTISGNAGLISLLLAAAQ